MGGLRVGLIGAGAISSAHASAVNILSGTQLVAVCDPISSRANAIAGQFGVERVFPSANEMLERAELDAVHVLTPPQFHIDVAIAALRAGCHVLVEKPLGLTVAECDRLRTESAQLRLIGAVNHTMTYCPVLERLIAVIRDRSLGRVDHVSISYSIPPEDLPLSDPGNPMFRSPESILLELGPHPMSLVRLLMGSVLEASTLVSGLKETPGAPRFYDSWQCQFLCERGTASLYLAAGKSLRQAAIRVIGQDATAQVDLLRGALHLTQASPRLIAGPLDEAFRHAAESVVQPSKSLLNHYVSALYKPSSRRSDPFVRSLDAFYQSIRTESKPREDFAAGRAVVEYCQAAVNNIKLSTRLEGDTDGARR